MPGSGGSARPVTGYLRGGLGNQMFIAAAALAQSNRLGVPLALDRSFLDRTRQHPGDLSVLAHGAQIVNTAPRWIGVEPGSRRARAARKLHPATSVFVEHGYRYDPDIQSIGPGTLLSGYFQSWRYFHDIAEEVRSRFSNLLERSPWFDRIAADLVGREPWIGIHIRQGDYLHPEVSRNHGSVGGQYVQRALKAVRDQGVRGEVVLFSDDPDRARALHPELGDAFAIHPPEEAHAAESLLLMSGAHALVMANSSFSWWAGYLGDRPGRPVICPRPWFEALRNDPRDLLLPHWITVERRDL